MTLASIAITNAIVHPSYHSTISYYQDFFKRVLFYDINTTLIYSMIADAVLHEYY